MLNCTGNPAQTLDFIPDNPAELRTAVTRMAAHINAVDWQFLKLIGAMDSTRGWREGGYCNLSNWLDHRCGMSGCAARERVRISRALVKLPCIDAAFRDGTISYSKVRAVTRIATTETDEMLLAIARQSSAAQLDGLVRTYERVGGKKRSTPDQQRSVTWHYEDGMLIVTAAVPAAQGALLIKALEKVVGSKRDEQEAYYESLNASECHPVKTESEDESYGLVEHHPSDVSAETPEQVVAIRRDEPGAYYVSLNAPECHAVNPESEDESPGLVEHQPDNVSAETPEQVQGTKRDETGAYYEPSNAAECQPVIAETSEHESTPLDAQGPDNVPREEFTENQSRHFPGQSPGDVEVSAETTDKTRRARSAPTHIQQTAFDPVKMLSFQHASREQRFADALMDIAEHYLSGSGQCKQRRPGQRYEVMLHIDRNHLAEQQQHNNTRFYIDPDWGIDEDEARQIACDADITEFIQNEKGDFLNYERRRRIVPPRLLRALKIRHGNLCSFPGCSHRQYLEAHHVRHWIDGGETSIDNMALLCSAHHRLLHHRAFQMTVLDGDVVFVSRDGEVIETTLETQFPDVSAEAPTELPAMPVVMSQLPESPLFAQRPDNDIVDMLDFRERWGGKRKDRLLAQILK